MKEQGWKVNKVGWGYPVAASRAPRKQRDMASLAPTLEVYPSPTRPKEPGSFPHTPACPTLCSLLTSFIYKVFIAK